MKLFAHRGASAYAPQNTLPAFQKALEMEARFIELDVQLTSDHVPVVIHDFFMDKTTDAKGFIHGLSWDEVRKADGGSWFSSEFKGTKVPSLEEVLELVPKDICLNVEIKSLGFVPEPAAKTISELLNQEQGRNLIVSSFNHRVLREFQDLSPQIPLGLLSGSEMIDLPSYVKNAGLKLGSVHPEASYLSPTFVEMAHQNAWEVICYTINSKEQAALLEEMGVDGFFSDYPDLMD